MYCCNIVLVIIIIIITTQWVQSNRTMILSDYRYRKVSSIRLNETSGSRPTNRLLKQDEWESSVWEIREEEDRLTNKYSRRMETVFFLCPSDSQNAQTSKSECSVRKFVSFAMGHQLIKWNLEKVKWNRITYLTSEASGGFQSTQWTLVLAFRLTWCKILSSLRKARN